MSDETVDPQIDEKIEETQKETDELKKALEVPKGKPGRPLGSPNKNQVYLQKMREQAKAKEKLWRQGILHWKLDSNQRDLYKDYYNENGHKQKVWSCSRQIGKGWTVCTLILEEAIKRPGIRMVYLAPELNDAKDIVEQTISQITEDCPEDLRPNFNSIKNRWEWPNGSFLKLAGTDNKNYKKIRGRKYDRIFLDEFCFMDEFRTVFFSCVKPTTTSVQDYKIVFISTPPETADHESNLILDQAEEDGTLITRTIYDCPRFSKEYIEQNILKDYRLLGGADSVDFKREYMCLRIADTNKLVIPEATEKKVTEITANIVRPEFFNILEAYDWGVMDNNAGLFSYVDYRNNRLVIENELWMDGIHNTTDEIQAKIKEIEKDTFPIKHGEILRFCDNNLQIINDMNLMYQINMIATKKDNLHAAINHVRKLIANNQIVINPRCVNLIAQLKSATWKTDQKREFSRRNGHHYDLIAALIYLVRNANLEIDPFPELHGIPRDGSVCIPKGYTDKKEDTASKFFNNLFTIKRKNRTIKQD
jgi:phage terminase large subunit